MTSPADVRELAAKAADITLIGLLDEGFWYGDYVRDLVAEHVIPAVLAAVSPVIRRQVAEEIAEDIDEKIGGYPGNEVRRPHVDRGELLNDAHWAAAIARTHAHPEEGK